ncbi:tRNA pseudouridine65 synthase [Rubritalea squalenifaciens DSM 18772]|uniref:tRNA pseudouridine synthase C n=1 Tax=Rubritalea squalenifaciens DSM 18772 TaxID=1123071 RepID=A0A1M6NR87_9BACT|nr:pseudouridine synthase [Rubritalea squalenifaciens]SHJ98223.1 tRNA pseudouridine65 synthase [Rubritalea squalenifaciens DSM 18772]
MSEKLEILYRDEWMCVVDKPAGWLVHPADEPQEGDLVAMKVLRDQIGERVNSVHRLDRPTCGVLLFGIEKEATRKLHKALERHEFEKTYRAIVSGVPEQQEWECREPIQKKEGAPVRDAWTSFRVLEIRVVDGEHFSLIEAVPHTGRFHQIRRHLLHAGLPIVGDYRYAGMERSDHLCDLLGVGTRMLLQASRLELAHPMNGKVLSIKVKGVMGFGSLPA